MKKPIGFLLVLLVLSGASWYGYSYYFGGRDYYTKITETGETSNSIGSNGESLTSYQYTQKAYDKEGSETTQEMNEYRKDPLRIGAYLKLKVNDRKGVLSWEEVTEQEVPAKALQKIEDTQQ